MSELIFMVEDAPEGGFIARALGASIFTDADTQAELHGKSWMCCAATLTGDRRPRSFVYTTSAKKSSQYEAYLNFRTVIRDTMEYPIILEKTLKPVATLSTVPPYKAASPKGGP